MEQLNDEDCKVLEAVRIDCHSHRLNTSVRTQLYLQATTIETKLYLYLSLVGLLDLVIQET